jgi:hypothetical protein
VCLLILDPCWALGVFDSRAKERVACERDSSQMMMTAKQIDEAQPEASAWPFRKGTLPAPKKDPAGTCAEDKPERRSDEKRRA